MEKLARKNKDKVIDVLTERLAFERSGVKLYDKIIQSMQRSANPQVQRMLDPMKEHRDQEKEHASRDGEALVPGGPGRARLDADAPVTRR